MEMGPVQLEPVRKRPSQIMLFTFLLVSGLSCNYNECLVFGAEVPAHDNHTLFLAGEESLFLDGLSLSVVAVGDLLDRREMIVWMEIYNQDDSRVFFSPSSVQARTGGVGVDGEWRDVMYHCDSQRKGLVHCFDANYTRWLDSSVVVEGSSSVGCWVVFGFSKAEFDSARSLTLRYRGSNLTLPLSSGRTPRLTPALEVLWPRQGVRYTRPERVRFLVWDRFETWNWTVSIDGKEIKKGSVFTHSSICPERVVFGVQSLDVGYHTVVVSVSSGVLTESSVIDFAVDPRGVLGLRVEWVFNASDRLDMVVGPGEMSGFTAWDIDGDGLKELMFPNCKGVTRRVWCIDGQGRFEWIYPPIDKEGLKGDPRTKPSLADLDRDGVYEICVTGGEGRLHVLNPDGSVYWVWDNPLGKPVNGPPQVMDVDGDGYMEFFLVDQAGNLHRINHTGKSAWSQPISKGLQGAPNLADIDSDGTIEVLWTSFNGWIWCASTENGYLEWKHQHRHDLIESQILVVDLNQDQEYEALTWTSGPPFQVLILDSNGEEAKTWTTPYMGKTRFGQALGDVDQDGSLDLVIVSNLAIRCLGFQGLQPYTKWEIDIENWVEQGRIPSGVYLTDWSPYQLIADIDGDAQQEVLLALPYPMVIDGATGQLESYYINDYIAPQKRHITGSWWGDIDQDGLSEWVIELEGWYYRQTQTYCLTMNGQFPAPSPWPEYYHTAYPAPYQQEQGWLTLKSAGSNSLWFPIPELSGGSSPVFVVVLSLGCSLVFLRRYHGRLAYGEGFQV